LTISRISVANLEPPSRTPSNVLKAPELQRARWTIAAGSLFSRHCFRYERSSGCPPRPWTRMYISSGWFARIALRTRLSLLRRGIAEARSPFHLDHCSLPFFPNGQTTLLLLLFLLGSREVGAKAVARPPTPENGAALCGGGSIAHRAAMSIDIVSEIGRSSPQFCPCRLGTNTRW